MKTAVHAKEMSRAVFHCELGPIVVTATEDGIVGVDFVETTSTCEVRGTEAGARWAELAVEQLKEYFAGTRRIFDLPLLPSGTQFQQQVWRALCDVPYGETRSYRDIAIAIGNDKAVRAVGQANRRNPFPIIVPCHRVIGAGGDLVGYAGSQVHLKSYLLNHEQLIKAAAQSLV